MSKLLKKKKRYMALLIVVFMIVGMAPLTMTASASDSGPFEITKEVVGAVWNGSEGLYETQSTTVSYKITVTITRELTYSYTNYLDSEGFYFVDFMDSSGTVIPSSIIVGGSWSPNYDPTVVVPFNDGDFDIIDKGTVGAHRVLSITFEDPDIPTALGVGSVIIFEYQVEYEGWKNHQKNENTVYLLKSIGTANYFDSDPIRDYAEENSVASASATIRLIRDIEVDVEKSVHTINGSMPSETDDDTGYFITYVGDEIIYLVTVTNISEVDVAYLENVTDILPGAVLCDADGAPIGAFVPKILAPGVSVELYFKYVVTSNDLGIGEIINKATAEFVCRCEFCREYVDAEPIEHTADSNEVTVLVIESSEADYKVEHWIVGAATPYSTDSKTGPVETEATATPITIPGYTLNLSHAGTIASGIINANGSLVLKLFYVYNGGGGDNGPGTNPAPDDDDDDVDDNDNDDDDDDTDTGTDADDDADDEDDNDGDDEDEEQQPHVSGGNDPYIPPAPTTRGNTLVPSGNGEFIEFDEFGTPLGEWRWDDFEEIWVFEEYPPLTEFTVSEMPRTGIPSAMWIYIVGFGLSMLLGTLHLYRLVSSRNKKVLGSLNRK